MDVPTAPITSIGSMTIAGLISQYQILIGAEDGSTDPISLGFFIGQQVCHLYQYQTRP